MMVLKKLSTGIKNCDKSISEKIIHENIHFATIMRPHLADEGLRF